MLDLAMFEAYKEQRKPRWYWEETKVHFTSAAQALRTVRYNRKLAELKARFEKAGGYECQDYEQLASGGPTEREPGRLRLVQCADEIMSFDDLAGDNYNAEANPDVPKHIMDAERQAFIDRVNSDGVWGFRSEVWDGDEWIETDSCWGFVGDDFNGSGYEGDFYDSALEAFEAIQEEEARDFEATRPDMYEMKGTPSGANAWNKHEFPADKRRKLAATAFAAAMLGV